MPTSLRASAVDACPGALDTHPAADGELARVRVPGGRLDARQAWALAEAAEEFGDGHLELTSRANLQVRGLAAARAGAFAQRLSDIGLLPSATHEKIRNIVGSPLSGRATREYRDVTPVVADLDRALCAAPDLAALPGRFLVTVDDGSGDVAGLGGDIGLTAVGPDQDGPLLLRVAGPAVGSGGGGTVAAGPAGATGAVPTAGAGAVAPALLVARDRAAVAVVAAARAFLAERATANAAPAWRIAELPDGHDRVLAAAAAAAGGSRIHAGAGAAGQPRRPVGVVEQRDGRRALAVAVPLGRLTAGSLRTLVEASRDGCDELRLTPWRSVVVLDLPVGAADRWATAAALAGLVVDAGSPWVVTSACAGRPGCAKSLADVRADAAAVVPATSLLRPGAPQDDGPAAGGTPVHWSGCQRRCGAPAGRPYVDVLATEAGYHVRRGERDFGTSADRLSVASAVRAGREGQ